MTKKINHDEFICLLSKFNDVLRLNNVASEILLYGGAAISFYNQNRLFSDIDFVWRDDSGKAPALLDKFSDIFIHDKHFFNTDVSFNLQDVCFENFDDPLIFSNLKVTIASPDLLLAMKILSCRDPWTSDHDDTADIRSLIQYLNINSMTQIHTLMFRHYGEMPPKRNLLIVKDILKENKGYETEGITIHGGIEENSIISGKPLVGVCLGA